MNVARKNIVVLGSTGSIGLNALDVVACAGDRFKVVGLSAHTQLDQLVRQARSFSPVWIAATNDKMANSFDWPELPATQICIGHEAVCERVVDSSVDIVVAAIVGVAGLKSNWAALGASKTIALANKETLVVAGKLAIDRAAESGATILPVDSEHSAIFQAAQAGRAHEIERIILTASGGPFREKSLKQMAGVSVQETLAHPTWNMGRKISVDSATMMNKALEIIEARWLFDLPPDRISVVIHPESIVHSLVEFRDGSVVAQMGPPDMRLPIQYALTYPDRIEGPAEKMKWDEIHQLNFIPPDLDRFPALALGFEVAERGGTCGAVLNAANEAAVSAFLKQQIGFTDIVTACREVLDQHQFIPEPTLEQVIAADHWARQETNKWIST